MKCPNLLRPGRYIGKADDLAALKAVLFENNGWLKNRFLQLFEGQDTPSSEVPPLLVPWHTNIPEMSAALVQTIDVLTEAEALVPLLNDHELPIVKLTGAITQNHTCDCRSLTDCLTVFKRLTKAYIDLALLKLDNALERTIAIDFLNSCFDPCEVALCGHWEKKKTSPGNQAPTQGQAGRFFAAVYDNASVGIGIITPEGTLALVNAKCAELFGTPIEEITGDSISKFIHPDEMEEVFYNMALLLSGEIETVRAERRLVRKDGSSIYVDISSAAIRGDDGDIECLVTVLADITERKQMEESLVTSERELQRYKELMEVIMDGTPAIMGYVDTNLRYKFVNRYYENLYGINPAEVIGKRVPELLGDAVFAKVEKYYDKALGGEAARFELTFDSPVLGPRYLEVNYLPHIFENAIEGIIILILDATERKEAELDRDRFFDVSLDMFYVAGYDGYFRQTNPACTRILGWTADELKGQKIMKFAHPDDRRATLEKFREIGEGKSVVSFENRSLCKDGTYRWITWNSMGLQDEERVYAIGHDTTNRHEMEEQLRTMATIDPLTKVMNRRHFFDLGESEFAKAKRYNNVMSVFMLDLDHFKEVNDTHGHLAGDQVLGNVATICHDILRESDIFCRYGGEEFSGILMEATAESAQATAQRLIDGLAAYACTVDGHNIGVTASIGTATITKEDDCLEALLNRADTALYAAKRKGRNCIVHL